MAVKKETKKKKKKSNSVAYKMLSFLLVIMTVICLSLIIYNEIFSILMTIPIIIVSLFISFLLIKILNSRLRKWIKNFFSFLTIIIIIFELLLCIFGTRTIKFITNLTDTGYRVDTYGIYVLDEGNIEKTSDLDGLKVGIVSYDDNTRKAINLLEKKADVEVEEKGNLEKLLSSVINKEVSAIILEESYESIIKDEFENVIERLKKIDELDIIHYVDTVKSSKEIDKDSFIVYISGIDTSGKVASKARSDVNILLAINPTTGKILMINTPRDYYVTLHSKNQKDKLTHAGIYGIEESIETLNDLYDINIDYYVRINFSSFLDIINALGGIKVNVKYNICEQDSKRNKQNKICVYKGVHTLNGEEALAYARHRHTIGDRQRGSNQMDVLEAIINKATSPKIITKYNSILNAIGDKIVTNMEFEDMKDFINMQIKKKISWDYENISADGVNAFLPCYSLGNRKASVINPDSSTIDRIKESYNNLVNGKDELVIETTSSTTKK